MRAALITGRHRLELVEFPEPTPAAGGVVVAIDRCGICGTDVHAYGSDGPYPPAICGHEWTGRLAAVGAEVGATWSEGDRVVIASPPACGACDACHAGQARWCVAAFLVAIGRDPGAPPHGGFASQLAVDASRVLRVDPRLSIEQAAQVEPASVSFHAVRHTPPGLGDVAVVQGAGPVGLTTLQWVRAAGAGAVVVVEPNEVRRALAAELGATHAVVPADAKPTVNELTRGLGADVVYECVGRPDAVQAAVDLARRGGAMCLIGVADGQASISPASWLVKEIEVRAALAFTHDDVERAMGMIADGRIALDPLHTSTVGLDDLDAAFADLAGGSTGEVKVLVDPNR